MQAAAHTEIIHGGGKSSRIKPQAIYGYALSRGSDQHHMEDFHVAQMVTRGNEELGFFAIFDGHGGPNVSRYLQSHLLNNILNEGGFKSDPAGATRDGYLYTDSEILREGIQGGSTGVTLMIVENGNRMIVGNVGDARAVLCNTGKAVQLSVDHDPQRPVERANVEMKGGVVITMPGDIPRVDGQLAVARAFGDKSLKEHMTAKPDVTDRIIDLDTEFVILGSNGLWKCVENDEAVEMVKQNAWEPHVAAVQLVRLAQKRCVGDDVSVLVIKFQEL